MDNNKIIRNYLGVIEKEVRLSYPHQIGYYEVFFDKFIFININIELKNEKDVNIFQEILTKYSFTKEYEYDKFDFFGDFDSKTTIRSYVYIAKNEVILHQIRVNGLKELIN